ncbi:MAG: group II intron maturase-specific domain-containing protein [Methylococcales bacterium]
MCAFRFKEDAESFYRVLPKRLGKFGLDVAPEKTQVLRFSRFLPSMKRQFTFLGFELYWFPDRQGVMRVKPRTSRKKLQGACRRIQKWIRDNRHLKGKQFIKELNRRLQGHYNYYGLRGNSDSLYRFYKWAKSSILSQIDANSFPTTGDHNQRVSLPITAFAVDGTRLIGYAVLKLQPNAKPRESNHAH